MKVFINTRFAVLVAFFCLGLVSLSENALSDEFSFFINYTANNGLPSSKVYDIMEDSKGFVWIATENGVVRFDGNDFKDFTVREGLPTNSTLRIYEDRFGRIWFLSYLGPISYYENLKIHPHPLNSELKALGVGFFTDIYVDSLDNLLLAKFIGGHIKISNRGIITDYGAGKTNNAKKIELIAKENKLIGWFTNSESGTLSANNLYSPDHEKIILFIESPHINTNLAYCSNGKQTAISIGQELFIVERGQIVEHKPYKGLITGLLYDQNNYLWVNERFNGTHLYANNRFDTTIKSFLKGKTVSKVIQTSDGNYWFSTTEDGIYFVPSIRFNTFNKNTPGLANDNIISMANFDSVLFFSTTGKKFFRAMITKNHLNKIKPFKFNNDIVTNFNDVLPISRHDLIITGITYEFVKKKKAYPNYLNPPFRISMAGYGYSLYKTSKNEIIVCNKGGIQAYKGSRLIYASIEDSFHVKTFCVLELPDSSLLLGTVNGLYVFKDGKYEKHKHENPILTTRISTLNLINGDIWIGTFDNGLVIEQDGEGKSVSVNDGLGSNRIKTVLQMNDSVIWIGTNKGLSKVLLIGGGKMQIISYSIWDGLPSNEINDLLYHDGFLWLATTKGLVSLDPNLLNKHRAAPVLIVEKIAVNGSDTVFKDSKPKLACSQNNIAFYYTAIDHYDPKKTTFHFKLKGMENNWRQTNAKTIHFDDLPFGDYSFKLKVKNATGQWGNTYQFDFAIERHFTETLWFRAIAVLSLLAMVILFFLFILHRQKKRDELKRRVLVSEQKAMRSQMNPHFIFNSLNSIQDIVLNKKTGAASRFIVDFSALLRRILELSKHNMVSLSEELKTIELYLSLEKTRLSGKFDYRVSIDESIDNIDMGIPSMIIQPLLENAIWHGIAPLPKNAKAYVSVKISQAQNLVYISITDNGIGRKKSLEIEKARSFGKATGLSNINERINLANKIYKANIKLQIDDLFPEKEFTGTSVRISFAIIE
ncbi:MAG: hypothetical protein GXO89_06620 [Chlorobi bacterium]|nr:hypothetical protein [Chlorobiota bacterium]